MTTKTDSIARVVQTVNLYKDLPDKFANATRVHWELIEVFDFYREETAPTEESRARTHLEDL